MEKLEVAMAAVLAALPTLLPGQARPDPHAVQPERPTVATHAYTVAPGWLEIETGLEADRFNDHSHAVVVPSNLKLGLTTHAQLNVLVPIQGQDIASLGLGDVAVGVKWRVVDRHPVLGSFALLPFVKLASGAVASARGTGTTDVSLTVISSRTVGTVAMDLNAAYTIRSGDGTQAPKRASFWTASFGIPVLGRLGWALEYYGYPATSGRAGSSAYSAIVTGPTATLRTWLVIDAGVIVPLAGPQTYALYAGLVWNAGRVWRARAP